MVEENLQQQQEDGWKCGGSRNGKKAKQKKIPQRGLGVAQLEKIRLEEQQKKQQAFVGPSSCFMLPPLHSSTLTTPTSDFKTALPVPSFEFFNPLSPSPPPPPAPPNPSSDGNFLSMMWNGTDYRSHDAEARILQGKQLPLMQSKSPSFNLLSMVNVSSSQAISSSGINLQIEPPSNQIYLSSSDSALPWPGEERMVGMKRPWPFFLSNPPGGPAFSPSMRRWDEPSYWPDKLKLEPGSTSSRDSQGPSSNSVQCNELPKATNGGKLHESLDGGFLTLGPPPMPNTAIQDEELSHVAYQEMEDSKFSGNGSIQPLPPPQQGPQDERQVLLHSFLPVGLPGASGTFGDRRREETEGVDLRLKL